MEDNLTDSQLLERVRDSDGEAFRVLFDRYQPVLFRHLSFRTGQADLSHEIVQETFLRVWDHRRSLRPHLSFLAYLFRISGNLVRDEHRRTKRRRKMESDVPPPALSEGDNPEEALHLSVLSEQISTIIREELPTRCREIFLLSRFEGKTNRETAEMLGLSIRTVEHQINHALKVIRKRLRQSD